MGRRHTVLLQSSGRALGLGATWSDFGDGSDSGAGKLFESTMIEANKHGQCNIPDIPSNLDYVQARLGKSDNFLFVSFKLNLDSHS